MLVTENEIITIIPQQPPFVMIGALNECNEKHVSTSTLIRADNILAENGFLSEAGLIENIAQTAAAGAGYRAKSQNKPVLNGFIGAINNLEIFMLPKVGDLLKTEVTIADEIFSVTLINGKVYCNARLLALCEMKIFTQAE